jgi:hypothetical protein
VVVIRRPVTANPSAVRNNQMCRRERWPPRERHRQAIADATIGQQQRRPVARTFHLNRRQQERNRCARTNRVTQSNTTIRTCCEIARTTADHVVTYDTDAANAVMQPIERGTVQLRQTVRNQAAQFRERSDHPSPQPYVQTVGEQVSTPKVPGITNQLVECQADGGIVRGNDGTCARAHDDVDGNVVLHELLQYAHVAGAAQPAAAEYETDSNGRVARGQPFPRRLSERVLRLHARLPIEVAWDPRSFHGLPDSGFLSLILEREGPPHNLSRAAVHSRRAHVRAPHITPT